MKIRAFNSSEISTLFVETSGQVTVSGAALTDWYTYPMEKQTASFTDSLAGNIQNGTTVYTETITYIFNKLQLAFRNELKTLGQKTVHIAVEDNNGVAWLFGYTRGMDLVTAESASGTNYEDRSGYTLTFTGMEPNPIVTISNYSDL
jgi:hypothetical protein